MKKYTCIFFIFLSLIARSQIRFELYYSEKQLTVILQQAKTNWDKMNAQGMLASYYKLSNKDSLALSYLKKLKSVAEGSKDVKLKARALWWDNYYDSDTTKAKRYIDFANKNNLIEDEIAGYVELTRINIHIKLDVAEQNALMAKKLWNEWKIDSIGKDSLKLEIWKQLAHVYVHKRDGIKVITYLLPLQDYAMQERDLLLKEQALDGLTGMYDEWTGQSKRAIEWGVRLYEFYKKLNNPNKLLIGNYGMAMQYCYSGDTVKARYYCNETERLLDSIGTFTRNIIWLNQAKYYAKLISLKEYVSLIETNFNNRYFLSPAERASLKLALYSDAGKLDSVKYYLGIYKKLAGDSTAKNDQNFKSLQASYYLDTKQYNLAIPAFKELKEEAEKEGSLSTTRWLCKLLADAYAASHDYKNAHAFLEQAYKLKDSLEKLGGKEEVSLMEMQKQAELQTSSYNEEKKLQAAEQARVRFKNRVSLYGLLAGVAILLLVAGLLWRNNRQKQKAKSKIESAYSELKNTQSQLIQSEKMASLGELTAGIAHEIQNPLNFVNNFSEVNKELIAEMREEIKKGNYDEVNALAKDVEDNQEKINHHGKRADAIVKGMLQHSRSSNGQKESTDINALCDEYLRLSYHGLRAKDKSFNASMKTDFDETIGNINIIPQDIGRVILNLINNAFYAVDEKKKSGIENFEPTVSVSTKKNNGKVEIKVSDNGNGIPQKVLDKIFQPFFTTKPTGQGTGLGLSLSYDIIKAHGGELKVVTKEGEGSEFIILLSPVKEEVK